MERLHWLKGHGIITACYSNLKTYLYHIYFLRVRCGWLSFLHNPSLLNCHQSRFNELALHWLLSSSIHHYTWGCFLCVCMFIAQRTSTSVMLFCNLAGCRQLQTLVCSSPVSRPRVILPWLKPLFNAGSFSPLPTAGKLHLHLLTLFGVFFKPDCDLWRISLFKL